MSSIPDSDTDPGDGGWTDTGYDFGSSGGGGGGGGNGAVAGLQGGSSGYSNLFPTGSAGSGGHNWYSTARPTLTVREDGLLVYTGLARRKLLFQFMDGGYTTFFDSPGKLVSETVSSVSVFTFTGANGTKAVFARTGSTPGKLLRYILPDGNVQNFSYDGSSRVTSMTRVLNPGTGASSGYYYAYTGGSMLIDSITLKINGVNVERERTEYYGSSEDYGLEGDLKLKITEVYVAATSSWAETGRTYYRYYKTNTSTGFTHGLQFKVTTEGWKKAVGYGLDPLVADEENLAPYAEIYLEYEATTRRVAKEVRDGVTIHLFAYATQEPTWGNFTATDFNRWTLKTTHTRPDGNEEIFYSNQFGQVLLKVTKDVSTSDEWYDYVYRNTDGSVSYKASSAAIASYSEGSVPMATLHSTAGLIHTYTYTGKKNLATTSVKKGSSGTPILLKTKTYGSPIANVEYLTAVTVQQTETTNEAPTTTSFSYTFHTDTFQMSKRVTTLPAVPETQNGRNTTAISTEIFDANGNLTWRRDALGFLTAFFYDPINFALVQQIDDVDTAILTAPESWETPEGGGLHLITDYAVDQKGRRIEELGPEHTISLHGVATAIRQAKWTQYFDALDAIRTCQGYFKVSTSAKVCIAPLRFSRRNLTDPDVINGLMNEEVAVAYEGALPTDWIEFSRADWVRWRTEHYDPTGRMSDARAYHLIPASGAGTSGTNYGQTDYFYDQMSRPYQVNHAGGNMELTYFTVMGWVQTVLKGTVEAQVGSFYNEYDGGSDGGNGTLTRVVLQIDDDSGNDREQTFTYDWRDRQVEAEVNDGVRTLITQRTYDNRDNVIRVDEYIGMVDAANLLNRAESFFDMRNQPYRTIRYGVEAENGGAVLNALPHETYYDQRGQVVRQTPAGKFGFTVSFYDGIGRTIKTCHAYGPIIVSDEDDPQDLSESVVFTQIETTYDKASNPIAAVTRRRFDDASGNGELGDHNTEPLARVSYVATYPDGIGRTQAVANYGTYGSAAWTRSATVPTRENIVTSGASRTTRYAYNLDNNLIRLIAENPTTDPITKEQVTEWEYGVSVEKGSMFSRNTLVYKKIYPDGGEVVYTYNRQGNLIGMTVQDDEETVHAAHAYTYDKVGRLIADRVTAVGAGVDDTVKKITRSYEARGLLEKVTSLDIVLEAMVEVEVILNQVQFAYNAYSQLVTDYQKHDGEVDTGTTLSVGYRYEDGSAIGNIRRTTIVYPDESELTIAYENDPATMLSRPDGLKEGMTPLCSYRYLGSGRIIGVKYDAASDVELTYEGGTVDDAGDKYTGLDRFGRLVETIWKIAGEPDEILVHSKYARNDFGGAVFRRDEKAHAVPVTTEDHYYVYDELYQVTQHQRCNLTGTWPEYVPSSPVQTEYWGYDATGNWETYENNTPFNVQGRTHNTSNQITEIASAAGPVEPTYDPAGNMLTIPVAPGTSAAVYTLTWDAWNRLVKVEASETLVASYTYDGLTRRVSKTVAGPEVRHYYYNDQWRALEERVDGAEEDVDRQYTWGMRDRWDLVRRKRSVGGDLDEVRFCLRDYLDPVAIIEVSGDIIERYAYNAFGTTRFLTANFGSAGSSACAWDFLFHGEFRDEDTKLYDYGYRYYHSELGRWFGRDPIAELGFDLTVISGKLKNSLQTRFSAQGAAKLYQEAKLSNDDQSDEANTLNLYVFNKNATIQFIDYLGLEYDYLEEIEDAVVENIKEALGAGELCVDDCCKVESLKKFRIIPENHCYLAGPLEPGKCYQIEAFYLPGGAIKVSNGRSLQIKCNKNDGSYIGWESGGISTPVTQVTPWDIKNKKPPVDDWPCGGKNTTIPPYRDEPPK